LLGQNQQSALGQFSIGRVGQFSISANNHRAHDQVTVGLDPVRHCEVDSWYVRRSSVIRIKFVVVIVQGVTVHPAKIPGIEEMITFRRAVTITLVGNEYINPQNRPKFSPTVSLQAKRLL
jgi:hypothetical protein